ncbi:MAG TPA: DUF4003 family protein [Nannocystis sp.]
MPFRSDDAPAGRLLADPFERWSDLHRALDAERTWLQDKVPLRLAAVALVTTPGDADALAAAVRRTDARLATRVHWLNSVVSDSVRLLIAAQLVKHDDDPDQYLDEVERVRAMFRAARVRQAYSYEYVTVLLLRRVLAGAPIQPAHVARFRAIYEAMKRHHWFLTGPEDYPACAMLVARDDEPEAIGAGIDAVYHALHRHAGLWRGDPLQTAANVLYLGRIPPREAAARFVLLRNAFREAGARIGQGQYDELAILCFLPWPVEKVVEIVMDLYHRLRLAVAWIDRGEALSLAAGLAFALLTESERALVPLADAKLLLDMQAIIAAGAAT